MVGETINIHLVFQRQGSNPQPFNHEPSALTTTRPWLLALLLLF